MHLFQNLSGTTPAQADTLPDTCASESNDLQNLTEARVQEDVQAECDGQVATSQVRMQDVVRKKTKKANKGQTLQVELNLVQGQDEN